MHHLFYKHGYHYEGIIACIGIYRITPTVGCITCIYRKSNYILMYLIPILPLYAAVVLYLQYKIYINT